MRDVSIIVPVYNGEKTVARCLDCLLAMRTGGYSAEILVVDDGSSDGTERLGREYAERFPDRIRYLRQRVNEGVSAARNRGLDESTGRFAAFVDCDDAVAEDYLLRLLQGMDEDIGLVCCGYEALAGGECFRQGFFDRSCDLRTETEKEEFYLRLLSDDYGQPKGQLRVTAIGVPWAKLFRRELIERAALRFSEKLRRSEDNDFVMRYAAVCGAIRYLDEPLYLYSVEHSRDVYNRFTPEDYRAIQEERDRFFAEGLLAETDRLRSFRCAEKAVMLQAAVKNIVSTARGKEAAAAVRSLAELPEFRFSEKDVKRRALSGKQRLYMAMYRLFRRGGYRLCAAVWRVFLWLRAMERRH